MKQHQQVSAIMVCCSSGPHFLERHLLFAEHQLGLSFNQSTILVPVFGGASVLAHKETFEHDSKFALKGLLFSLNEYEDTLKKIVLVNHEGCERAKSEAQGKKDLIKAQKTIEDYVPVGLDITIELWYAHLEIPENLESGLVFHKIETLECVGN